MPTDLTKWWATLRFCPPYCFFPLLLYGIVSIFPPFPVNAAEEKNIGFSALTDEYWQIWTMNPDQGTLRQITSSPGDKKEAVWFHDRQRLIYRTANA
ncbi:MAG: hypothetical protein V2I97_16830, partial [Desulfococcaceae bacterium]|nr:hypothetical protein [Desulfococcaceae bacterium]